MIGIPLSVWTVCPGLPYRRSDIRVVGSVIGGRFIGGGGKNAGGDGIPDVLPLGTIWVSPETVSFDLTILGLDFLSYIPDEDLVFPGM